jgi:hypothetical protein
MPRKWPPPKRDPYSPHPQGPKKKRAPPPVHKSRYGWGAVTAPNGTTYCVSSVGHPDHLHHYVIRKRPWYSAEVVETFIVYPRDNAKTRARIKQNAAKRARDLAAHDADPVLCPPKKRD